MYIMIKHPLVKHTRKGYIVYPEEYLYRITFTYISSLNTFKYFIPNPRTTHKKITARYKYVYQ